MKNSGRHYPQDVWPQRYLAPDTWPQETWLTEYLDCGFSYSIRSSRLLRKFHSAYQDIEIHDSDTFGRLLRLDGSFMTSERDEFFYHENLVHVAACAHEHPAQALIIGGGDGGSAEELLKHSTIEKITLVEMDEAVIEVARSYLSKVHHSAFDTAQGNPRLQVKIQDGMQYINNTAEQFDLIILDLTDPGEFSRPLYTAEFYRACASRLNAQGILSLHIASPFFQQDSMAGTLNNLKKAFNVVRPYLTAVPLYGGSWMMACASHAVDPANLASSDADARLDKRGVRGLQYYNGDIHQAAMALPNYVRNAISGLSATE